MSEAGHSWSTSQASGERTLRQWRELVAETFIACNITPFAADDFNASLTHYAFGPVGVQEVHSAGSHIERTREHIRRDRKDGYFVIQQRSGQVVIEQHGRTAIANPGDCILLSAKAPYSIQAQDHFIGLSMSVSNQILQSWLPDPECMTARTIDGKAGWGRALSATLSNFPETAPRGLALPEFVVVEQVMAQLAIALGTDTSPATRHQKALLKRLGETLSDRHREPDFDPSQLAEQHGLSKRYVHLLFARAGTSFGKELARVRLESARRLLEDHRFDCVDIMEIALRCGFRDSNGFSKRFRGQYGYPPSTYRQRLEGARAAG
ncbi:MAG: helix-turn-helix domain-containing protein [Candidatus Andeanibacterium colombiense]|uniref:Helix-turn-helix domain-containing protein n=1 Tax=Candidatus Andeanibacterium colombiense TaxID=3121345 RepID=A0AAJ5X7Y3_9SPHN|nr:MAG: helix-turn-helix domain-containing protein [Sphingomonadaceae bacterium]